MKLFDDNGYSRSERWYLRGWQHVPREDGKGSRFVYLGEQYGFGLPQRQRRRLKAELLGGCLGYIVLYMLGAFFPSAGAKVRLVAMPQMLSLAFMIFLVLGMGRLLLNKEPVPYSNYHAGYKRARVSWLLCGICSGLTLLAEAVFVVLRGNECLLWRELLFAAEIVVYTADCFQMWHLLRKYPYVVVAPEKGIEYYDSFREHTPEEKY